MHDGRTRSGRPVVTEPNAWLRTKLHGDSGAKLMLLLGSKRKSAERLQVERELYDSLKTEVLGGPTYTALTEYGLAVMDRWLESGLIFTECGMVGIKLLKRPIPFSDREDFRQQTVMLALQAFRKGMEQQTGWQPGRGASLTTYFKRSLLFQFANEWRKWLRKNTRNSGQPLEALPDDLESPDPGPEARWLQNDEADRAANSIRDETKRAVLRFVSQRLSLQEIAEIIGTTRWEVESLLWEIRDQLAVGDGERL
jgi:DNA-directed RNA polymerase specialized sigma24 family protein